MPLTTKSFEQRPLTALMILNPRDIPYCMDALRSINVAKCWLSYMPEVEAARCFNEAVAATSFDRYVLISDDCEPTQEAFDAVLALHDQGHPCVTGYSNFDADRNPETGEYTAKMPYVNLCYNRLEPPPPGFHSYRFYTQVEVNDAGLAGPIVTTFAGLSFTCMSRDMWLRHPAKVTSAGGQMDYQLSWDLQQAGIPIVAAVDAFVWHCKDEFGVYPDRLPEKQLLVGVREPAVTWTDLEYAR